MMELNLYKTTDETNRSLTAKPHQLYTHIKNRVLFIRISLIGIKTRGRKGRSDDANSITKPNWLHGTVDGIPLIFPCPFSNFKEKATAEWKAHQHQRQTIERLLASFPRFATNNERRPTHKQWLRNSSRCRRFVLKLCPWTNNKKLEIELKLQMQEDVQQDRWTCRGIHHCQGEITKSQRPLRREK